MLTCCQGLQASAALPAHSKNFAYAAALTALPCVNSPQHQHMLCACRAVLCCAQDVYSFGVVLWELWTLREPFEGINYHALLHMMSTSTEAVRPPLPGENLQGLQTASQALGFAVRRQPVLMLGASWHTCVVSS